MRLLGRLLVPAKFRATAHARASRDGQRAGLQIAVEHACLKKLDAGCRIDVAFQLAANDDGIGAHAAGDLRAGLDREVALNVDVALEVAGDANVAGAFDLAFDRLASRDQ